MTKYSCQFFGYATAVALVFGSWQMMQASSHMDAPLITYDDPANLADVYAFLTERDGEKRLVVGLSTYPFEEPGIGPNKYNFDPDVLYQIHLSLGDNVASGGDSISYQFQFDTSYATEQTILQSYLGVIDTIGDASQNLLQAYTITKVDHDANTTVALGSGFVPPNNQGIATPLYNIGNDGSQPARPGVSSELALDSYTQQAITSLEDGYRVFAGQREDGFYADIQAIFDLLSLRSGSESFDSQSGYNTHVIMLEIPVSELGGDMQVVGVHATTSRKAMRVLNDGEGSADPSNDGDWIQVGRLGNPLFCEALVAIEDKNLYNRTKPTSDATIFAKYAETPELAGLINALVFGGDAVAPANERADLVGIFIPDTIKVDLSTEPARLAGGGSNSSLPDQDGFSRLGIFGGDTLLSQVSAGFGDGLVSGGWPNGRRFGDDVIDIAVTAVISDLRTDPLTIRSADGIDNVSTNDSVYNQVFPYAATPHNGRNSKHNASLVVQTSPRLFNISSRGAVGTGDDVLIGGFIVTGDGPVKVLIRAMGPSLPGLANPLLDPVIEVYDSGTKILENDDWISDNREAIEATPFTPGDDREAAILVELEPGAYGTIVSGKNGSTGVGLFDAHLIE